MGTIDVEGGLQALDSVTTGERDCQVLLSSDSLGMLYTFNKVLFETEPTARTRVRQKEPDLQREVERVIARMCTREVLTLPSATKRHAIIESERDALTAPGTCLRGSLMIMQWTC